MPVHRFLFAVATLLCVALASAAPQDTKKEPGVVGQPQPPAKVDDKIVAFNNTAAKDAYDLAMANADGDRKIALANCEQNSGDAQKQCKDQVEADYSATKAKAEAAAQSQRK